MLSTYLMLTLLIVLNFLDVLTTLASLKAGAIDLNPLVNTSPNLWMMAKVVTLTALIFLVRFWGNQIRKRINHFLKPLVIIYVLAVINNVSFLLCVNILPQITFACYLVTILYILIESVKILISDMTTGAGDLLEP